MASEWPVGKEGASGPEAIACRDVTGLDCSYVAHRDWSPEEAGGSLVTQVLSQISFHISVTHPGHGRNAEMRAEIRRRIRV